MSDFCIQFQQVICMLIVSCPVRWTTLERRIILNIGDNEKIGKFFRFGIQRKSKYGILYCFIVLIYFFYPIEFQPINNTYLLQHSNFPASSFVITQSQNYPHRGTDPTATADRGFDLIIAKFLAAELLKESTKFEVDGNEYRLKDFRFRVGRAVIDKISKVKN